MAATNEERYCVETRSRIIAIERKLEHSQYEEDFVDEMDFYVGEVTMDRFSETVFVPYNQEVQKQQLEVVLETQRFDISTNTPEPIFKDKLVGTVTHQHEVSTSTSDIKKYTHDKGCYTDTDTFTNFKDKVDSTTTTSTLYTKPRSSTDRQVNWVDGKDINILTSSSVTNTHRMPVAENTRHLSTISESYVASSSDRSTSIATGSSSRPSSQILTNGSDSSTYFNDKTYVDSDASLKSMHSSEAAQVFEKDTDSQTDSERRMQGLRNTLLDKVNYINEEVQETNLDGHALSLITQHVFLTDAEISNIHRELNRLANERIDIIELLAINLGSVTSSLTVELLEAKITYSIGQTDQLLAMLEDSWELESKATCHNEQMLYIVKMIIQQSRSELLESKKTIKIYLEEVKYVLADSYRRKSLYNDILRLKRRAEIEAFKLERMWEQLFYERTKKKEYYMRSCLFGSGGPSPGSSSGDSGVEVTSSYVNYLTDRRERHAFSAAESELDDLKLQTQYMPLPKCLPHKHGATLETSGVWSGARACLSPTIHKDHLIELRRKIVADTKQGKGNMSSYYTRSLKVNFH